MTIFVLFTLPRSLVIVFSIGFYSNYNWAKKYQLKSQHWPFKQPGHPKLFFMQVNLIIPLYCYFGGGGGSEQYLYIPRSVHILFHHCVLNSLYKCSFLLICSHLLSDSCLSA